MINFKKGPALSLHQVNYLGKAKTSEGIVAGMVVTINGSGEVVKPTIAGTAVDKDLLLGFAINNQTSGDVIESGVIGVYALDGSSVIETDQTEFAINATNYPTGTRLSVVTGTGAVCTIANNYAGQVIGQVEGIRTIPGTIQTLNDNNGNPYKVQLPTTMLAIKLSSGATN
jgi:hypothetical protein